MNPSALTGKGAQASKTRLDMWHSVGAAGRAHGASANEAASTHRQHLLHHQILLVRQVLVRCHPRCRRLRCENVAGHHRKVTGGGGAAQSRGLRRAGAKGLQGRGVGRQARDLAGCL